MLETPPPSWSKNRPLNFSVASAQNGSRTLWNSDVKADTARHFAFHQETRTLHDTRFQRQA
jgi:hypothetical protein